jgi:formylglycine-generating enzyme required for sulfatase activity
MTKQKNVKTLVISLMLMVIVVACCGFFWFRQGKPKEICQSILLDSPDELPFSTVPEKPGMAIRSTDGMTMVYIPAGDFEMGWEDHRLEDGTLLIVDGDAKPIHMVYLDAYWIDQTEVTNSQYQKCVDAGFCTPPYFNDNVITSFIFRKNSTRIRNEYFYNSTLAQHPVVWMRWEQAQTYCHWAGGRLPTEAEWEKAARGTDGREYPWGDNFFGDWVNFCDVNGTCKFPDNDWDDGYQDTAPVGSYPDGASPYGVLDMAGNVSEWVADLYEYDYYGNSPAANPTGPACGEKRLLRGGSFGHSAANVRSTLRDEVNARWHSDSYGFRCAATAEGYQSPLEIKESE